MSFDFLLDPNVAYLILVGATLLTMMAVLNPGTGVLEIVALFLWLISAYIIFNLPINFWALGLMLLGVVLFLLSLRKIKSLIYLGLSIAAVISNSMSSHSTNGLCERVSTVSPTDQDSDQPPGSVPRFIWYATEPVSMGSDHVITMSALGGTPLS